MFITESVRFLNTMVPCFCPIFLLRLRLRQLIRVVFHHVIIIESLNRKFLNYIRSSSKLRLETASPETFHLTTSHSKAVHRVRLLCPLLFRPLKGRSQRLRVANHRSTVQLTPNVSQRF